MRRRELRLVPELRELLLDPNFHQFTVLDLRDAYEARYGLGQCESSSELRKLLYRRLLPLLKKGYLTKSTPNDDEPCRYQVEELFISEFHDSTRSEQDPETLMISGPESSRISALKAKLNQYQVDMLACAGECKEYQRLAKEYPHLKEQIEPMFRSARERSSELLGQVRAINNLLNQSGTSE